MGNNAYPSRASRSSYAIPPAGYASPSIAGCKTCGGPIFYTPLIGGFKWCHLTNTNADGHQVLLHEPWWDVDPGKWREPNDIWTPRRG